MNRISAALAAGFLGTLPFLGVVRAFPKLDKLELELIDTAAGLFKPGKQTAEVLKVAIPLTLGSVFALPYALFWERGWGRPDVASGITLGVAHGLTIILVKPAFRLAHLRPFKLPPKGIWVVGEIFNHAVYGVTVALCYRVLTEPKA